MKFDILPFRVTMLWPQLPRVKADGLMIVAVFLGLFASTPQAAAQTVDFDASILPDCLSLASSDIAEKACIGMAAMACIDKMQPVETSSQIEACYTREWEQWDDSLNKVYQTLLDQHGEIPGNTLSPNSIEMMRDMQRSWIGFRDQACGWKGSQWEEDIAFARCMMELTAQQTQFFEDMFI